MSQLKVARPTPLFKRYYSKNNKYIITTFHIIMLQKTMTLNKVLDNTGLIVITIFNDGF